MSPPRSQSKPRPSSSMRKTERSPGAAKGIVPSPHRDYLHVSLVNEDNLYGLLHSDATEDPQKASNSPVQYSPQWKIENIAKAMSKAEFHPWDEGQMLPNLRDDTTRMRALEIVQSNVVKEYAKLKTTVQTWFAEDAEEMSRWKQDSRSLARIDAKLVHESGGLMMQSYWRKVLGWRESTSTTQLANSKEVEYLFEAHAQDPDEKHKDGKKKFIWDFEQGKWSRAPDCRVAKAKKRSDRMVVLDAEIQKIKEMRDEALQKYGLGCVVNLNRDGSIDFTSGQSKDKAARESNPPPPPVIPTVAIEPVSIDASTKRKFIQEGEEDDAPKRRVPAKRPRTIRALKQLKR